MSNINKAAVLNPFSELNTNILDYVPRATTSEFGIVAIGSGINVDALGRIYLDTQEYSDRLTAIEAQAASSLDTQQTEVAAAIAQVNLTQSQTISALTTEVSNLKTNLTDSITATQTNLINRADQLAQDVTDITVQLTQDKATFTQEIQNALDYLKDDASVASALRTPRKINGTDFDGRSDITTNAWGATRTFKIGNKTISVDGTSNVDYSLADIGAFPEVGGTIQGDVEVTGNLSVGGTISATLEGTAASADKLLVARTINGVGFDGSENITLPLASTTVSGTVQLNNTLTSSNTDHALTAAQGKVLNDSKLDKDENAVSASKLETSRTISLTGGVTGSVSFDGSANASVATTVTGLGVANGIATLDSSGQVPSTQLPSYVDDVLEYLNVAAFPATGEAGKIYVETTGNTTYRWGGSGYVKITSGEVSSVAGKAGVVTLNKADVGLSDVDNTADVDKPVSNATQDAIISAVSPKADTTYVDTQLTLKVNKTDVIAIENGGTGATTAEEARTNLGLGTAASATLTTSNRDRTAGRVLKVGDFGLGALGTLPLIDNTSTEAYNLPTGIYAYGFPSKPVLNLRRGDAPWGTMLELAAVPSGGAKLHIFRADSTYAAPTASVNLLSDAELSSNFGLGTHPPVVSNYTDKGLNGLMFMQSADSSSNNTSPGLGNYAVRMHISRRGSNTHTDGSHSFQLGVSFASAASSNILRYRANHEGTWTGWFTQYSTANTTVDSNGFIKRASPIVDLYADRIELNEEAKQQPITFNQIGTGDYLIKGSTGFAQESWYIEQPKDANGNIYHAVIYNTLENGDISVKTYEQKLEGVRIVADLDKPVDIKENRFISIRLQELPQAENPIEEPPIEENPIETQPIEPEIVDNNGALAPSRLHELQDGDWIISEDNAAILENERLAAMKPLKRRQFRLTLAMNGYDLKEIEALIQNIDDPMQRTIAQIEWQDATDFERTNPTLLMMAELMQLTSEQVDQLWEYGLAL